MKTFETHLKKHVAELRLSSLEKQRMRAAIESAMIQTAATQTRSAFSWYFFSRHATAFSLVVIGIFMTTTAYAAQGTIPGQPLYPVKIYIDEPASGLFATSAQAKMQWNISLAQERMKEAEKLASRSMLTQTVASQLQSNIDVHTSQAIALAPQVDEQHAGAGVQLSTQLSASIGAHGAVLEKIAQQQQNPQIEENSKQLAQYALSKSASILLTTSPQLAVATLENQNANSSNASSSSAVADVKEKASEQLFLLENKFNGVKLSLSSTTVVAFDNQLDQIHGLINNTATTTSLSLEDQYKTALELEVVLQTFLDANKEFDNNLLSSLLSKTPGQISAENQKLDQQTLRGSKQIKKHDEKATPPTKIKINESGAASSSVQQLPQPNILNVIQNSIDTQTTKIPVPENPKQVGL